MSMKLYLDDERVEPEGWTRIKTVQEAKEFLLSGKVEELSLDHDLGTEETGYTLCLWMAETGNWPAKKPGIHSANPVGVANMRSVIERYFPSLIPQDKFASDFSEAFAALPEAYQADSCLEFFVNDGGLLCRPKPDQVFALGRWVSQYDPGKKEWV